MTAESRIAAHNAGRSSLLALALATAAAGIMYGHLHDVLQTMDWRHVLAPFQVDDIDAAILYYSTLPRFVMSLLAGAALGLAGAIFQHTLRNPLAEPTTLGASAGAQLALTAATLYAPALLGAGREWIALGGAAGATVLVVAIALGRTLAPLALILAGLVVSLLCGTIVSILTLFHWQYLSSLFVWGSGSLIQHDWGKVTYLLPRLAVVVVAVGFLARPLAVMTLDDAGARNLGLATRTIRLLALTAAVALAAFVVSAVGVIAFIGLAAPALARLSGARRVHEQLIWAPLIGAMLLWLTDQLVQSLWTTAVVPTGTATAFLGAPLLLWLLPRLRETATPNTSDDAPQPRTARPHLIGGIALALLALVLWTALDVGQGPHGWTVSNWDVLQPLLPWRGPRVMAALSAGAMLAVAGTLIQRMTGNPMASPEVLGISSGASLGVVLTIFAVVAPDKTLVFAAATAGSLATLFAMLMLGHRNAFSPERLLLAGIALGTIFSALVAVLVATGDPRVAVVLPWVSGSTDRVTSTDAWAALAIAAGGLLLVLPTARWLAILPLGDSTARSVGINLRISRLLLLVLAATLTAAATLIIGALSFVGLIAPHMARMCGLQQPLAQLVGAAVLGAVILIVADWLGRNLMFPYQIPAGLLATVVGGPYFILLMRRKAA